MANFISKTRRCAHPAGCELLAAPGDIYCEGCRTDPCLYDPDEWAGAGISAAETFSADDFAMDDVG